MRIVVIDDNGAIHRVHDVSVDSDDEHLEDLAAELSKHVASRVLAKHMGEIDKRIVDAIRSAWELGRRPSMAITEHEDKPLRDESWWRLMWEHFERGEK